MLIPINSLFGKVREIAQLCLTLCNLMDCSLPGSSVHGIFQARILEWVSISFSRGSSLSRDWTWVSCTAGRFFTVWAIREANSKQKRLLAECSDSFFASRKWQAEFSTYWDWIFRVGFLSPEIICFQISKFFFSCIIYELSYCIQLSWAQQAFNSLIDFISCQISQLMDLLHTLK